MVAVEIINTLGSVLGKVLSFRELHFLCIGAVKCHIARIDINILLYLICHSLIFTIV